MIEEYNPNKKRKILIFFDDMVADMLSNKQFNPIVTEIFVRGRKLNISLGFTILLCCAKKYQTKFYALFHHGNSKKRELQQIAFIHLPDIVFKDFVNLYKT